jgi:hypothetical protein
MRARARGELLLRPHAADLKRGCSPRGGRGYHWASSSRRFSRILFFGLVFQAQALLRF